MSIITTEWICTHCEQSYANNKILNQKCLYCGKGTVIERCIQTYTQSEVDEKVIEAIEGITELFEKSLVSLREKLNDADKGLYNNITAEQGVGSIESKIAFRIISLLKEQRDLIFDSVLKGDEK